MTAEPEPLDAFVDAMLQSYGQLALVVEHLLRNDPAETEAMPEILHSALRSVLEPLARRRGDTDVAVAAELLAGATDAIGADLFLVPLDQLNRRASPS
jgi:hypothetical protein